MVNKSKLAILNWVFPFLFNLPNFIQTLSVSEKITHDRRIPNALWKRTDHLLQSQKEKTVLRFRFGLKQSNIDNLYDELMRVSSPESPHYADHWDSDKVSRFFSPSNETIGEVLKWLKKEDKGFKKVELSRSRAWVHVHMSIDQAEKLLDTKFYKYIHTDDHTTHLACEQYKIPGHLSSHIDIVLPSVHFDTVPVTNKYSSMNDNQASNSLQNDRKMSQSWPTARHVGYPNSGNIPKHSTILNHHQLERVRRGVSNCGNVITLDCLNEVSLEFLRALYKFGRYKIKHPQNNSLAIVEFTPQSVLYSDLDHFFSNFSPQAKGSRPSLVPIDGGIVDQEDQDFGLNGESNLDLQYSMPFVHPLNVSLYQIGDTDMGGSFNNFLDALDSSYCEGHLDPLQDGVYPNPRGYNHRDCGTVKPANIISISYGMNEADATHAYLTRQCNEYGKLGLMGVTFIFSSGDNGVAGNRGICLNRDGTQSENGPLFNPSFPGTCPYVTSIGATQLPAGKTVNDSEAACYTRIRSGGGFSNLFKLPQYQSRVMKTYFKRHPPPYNHNTFNASRSTRGFPDISANGANYVVAVVGRFGLVYGTSASAPVVASILTMINDARMARGKKTIGFINPTLYSARFQEAFNDITNGSNPGCGTDGFSAVPGWDPVTGLGTLDFSKLLPLWTKLR
ncbi:putative aorsin endoprotease precursor [Melampsora larici-populina 98AG31]|uniref:tripeptidyl-peptidase II n=1 Tax=Melampsora larici-populina (strain 98AG31 / pathotype 3-4-7) TaxID=747676 RepID=F4RKI3_MELLP|nr:putative aorsin endoprotease precursor [Melampsora larici-populina 98AG31]EGG07175.1 putative aorsin endoprotease precursor [Melampsora larici-populina 98AG31]